jgi:phosphodiesterase/alkaline phosphatase D-like protein
MAVEFAYLVRCTDTTAAVLARATANSGTVVLSGAFASVSAAPTEARDGCVVLEATGLAPGTEYPATVTHDGDSHQVTLRTFESNPSRFVAGFGSCWVHEVHRDEVFHKIRKHDYQLFFQLGDMNYPDINGSDPSGIGCVAGVTINAASAPADYVLNYRRHFRSIRRKQVFRNAFSRIPQLYMFDDHELMDGWTWTAQCANGKHNSEQYPGSVEQFPDSDDAATKKTKIRNMYDLPRQALDDYLQGNPANTDASIDVYPAAAYFAVRIGKLVEFIVVDSNSYRNHYADTTTYTEPWGAADPVVDGENRTFYGRPGKGPIPDVALANDPNAPYQYDWIKSRLLKAQQDGVIHKIVMSGRKTYRDGGDNPDGLSEYEWERNDLLTWIDANITGCSWSGGDRHIPSVMAASKVGGFYANDGYDHLCVNACPLGQNIPSGNQGGWGSRIVGNNGANTIWRMGHHETFCDTATKWKAIYRVVGEIEIVPEYVEWRLRHVYTDDVVWSGRVYAGSNALTYPRPRLAG